MLLGVKIGCYMSLDWQLMIRMWGIDECVDGIRFRDKHSGLIIRLD